MKPTIAPVAELAFFRETTISGNASPLRSATSTRVGLVDSPVPDATASNELDANCLDPRFSKTSTSSPPRSVATMSGNPSRLKSAVASEVPSIFPAAETEVRSKKSPAPLFQNMSMSSSCANSEITAASFAPSMSKSAIENPRNASSIPKNPIWLVNWSGPVWNRSEICPVPLDPAVIATMSGNGSPSRSSTKMSLQRVRPTRTGIGASNPPAGFW